MKEQVVADTIASEVGALVRQPFGTVSDLIRAQARLNGAKPAVVEDLGRCIGYVEFDQLLDRVAAALQRDGVLPRQCIAIVAASSAAYLALFFGAIRAGVAVAPLQPSATADSLGRMVSDCEARLVFVDADADALLGHVPQAQRIRLDSSGFETWLAPAGATPAPVRPEPDWPFNIIYSSGTTGTPKGIVQPFGMRWPHCGLHDPPGYGPDAVAMIATPLYSNTTLVSVVPALAGGGTLVVMPRFDAGRYLELAERHGATHGMLVPVQYQRLLAHPRFDATDLSRFRMKYCTSAPFAAALKREVLDRWPGGLIEYYGMTEGGGSCMLAAHEHPDKLHTVGKPMPGHVFEVRDAEGKPCGPDVIGELYSHSPVVMTGYHNQPAQTASTIVVACDGRRFVRTGDIGRFDADGFLVLLDRTKDLIISGGFNIYPSDLEAVLSAHPQVAEAAVVGVPSAAWGETPVAFVVLEGGATADEIKSFANARLGKTQRIADVRVVAALPRSPIGKILKRQLRDEHIAAERSDPV